MVNGNAISIVQNLIYGNTAGTAGGGIYLGNSSNNLILVNNTIVGNTISRNVNISGAYVDGSQIAFNGSVTGTAFFNNVVVAGDTYSAIACNPDYQYLSPSPLQIEHSNVVNFSGPAFGGWCGVPPTTTNAMLTQDPKFALTGTEPFRPRSGSPELDSGTNSAPSLPDVDINGASRIQNGIVEMGAYEGSSVVAQSGVPRVLLAVTPASLSIPVEQLGSSTITVTPSGGYIGTVSLSCSNPPGNMICTLDPATLAVAGDNTRVTSTLSIRVLFANSVTQPMYSNSRVGAMSIPYWSIAGIVCLPLFRRKRFRNALMIVPLLSISIMLVSCGGGSPGSSPPPPPNQNSVVVAVTATARGNLATSTQTLNVTVTVRK